MHVCIWKNACGACSTDSNWVLSEQFFETLEDSLYESNGNFYEVLIILLEFLGYYLLFFFLQSWSSFRAVLWDGSRFSLWMKCEIDDYLGILFELLHRFTAILVASFRLFSWCQSARRIFHDSCRIFKILLAMLATFIRFWIVTGTLRPLPDVWRMLWILDWSDTSK